MTIHAKDSRSRNNGTTGVAIDGPVFTGVSDYSKPHERLSTYWIVASVSLILIREA